MILLALSSTLSFAQPYKFSRSGPADTLKYFASFESQNGLLEEKIFSNIGNTRTAINPLFYPESRLFFEKNTNKFWSRLLPNTRIGPSLLIKVDSTDKFDLFVEGFMLEDFPEGNIQKEVLSREIKRVTQSLLEPWFFGGSATNLKGGKLENKFSNSLSLLGDFNTREKGSLNQGSYLNWIFLDSNFAAIKSTEMGFVKVSERNKIEMLSATNLSSKRAKYLLVYLSNESNSSVYFDNLLVRQIKNTPAISLLSASFIITENGFNITTEGSVNLITEN